MGMKAKQIDFSNGRVVENVAFAAVPMLVAQVLNLMYNIVDRIYIGKIPGMGVLALGGIGLCFPIISLIAAFTNLFGTGGAPLCSIERGKGDLAEAEKIMNTSFYLLVLTGVVLTGIGQLFCRPMLRLFGASDITMEYALPYMRIYLTGTVFSMTALGMNPFINAQGFANIGMFTVFLGAVVNIALDPVFIFLLDMGAKGAAFATICSQCLSAVFVVWFLAGEKAELKLRKLRLPELLSGGRIWNIVSLGIASFTMQCTNSLVQISSNSMLGSFGGDIYISAMTVVSSVRQILDTPVMAVADGASPVMSYSYGAEDYGGVKKAVKLVTAVCLCYTAVVWLLILMVPTVFIGIFNKDEVLMAAAVPALHTYFFAFVFQALQYSGQTVFKSLNKKKQAIFFSLLRKVVIVVPLTFLLPRRKAFGVMGVFAAEPISNVLGGTICFVTMVCTVYRKLGNGMEK